jgi:hypothetical protein
MLLSTPLKQHSTFRQAQTLDKRLRVHQAPSGSVRRKLKPSINAFESRLRHFDKLNAAAPQAPSGTVQRSAQATFNITTLLLELFRAALQIP